MKTIAVMGSTGSIGTQTLDVVRRNGDIQVAGLSANRNVELLEKQVREFHPLLAVAGSEEAAADLRVRIADTDTRVASGMDGLIELAQMPESDVLVTAIVGMIGIRPTMAAIEAGKDIALANKETLVTAGHLIMPLAEKNRVRILPVDSEHCALFQCLQGGKHGEVYKLWITASGGPFRGKKREELKNMRPEDALKHPNWSMGAKITIDSATLVNKGLEIIEAGFLFDMPLDKIGVVVQPQSLVHSMVEFCDGAILAQISEPDMRLPIEYALYYPERRQTVIPRVDFHTLRQIAFEEPDTETFSGIPLALRAAREGGSMRTVFNAANEQAVALFLQKKIGFLDIYDIIAQAMDHHRRIPDPDLGQILETEKATRDWIKGRWSD
ncbi:1-deoxy-D-xylulose-5-phosphate reductoisomerase [Bilifractor porci]|jgi:1-deoxy-D-xylulose-5-phosphate reductoisomerase|uniref:1-deoxy-D-xylulose 5-phosphate reductoisomerase n=1 Tax=Bilifractor porci TaxID=2606636 RepID=A0A7X2P656_9FIRM|nr:1-deoxy-D-xylulose-5-phosphate reductoisomerase [Bilifractor porci]MST80928.1 1-deoxy-D-xylulose-5-phosphate reductoisomerase [Bilifractor porci]